LRLGRREIRARRLEAGQCFLQLGLNLELNFGERFPRGGLSLPGRVHALEPDVAFKKGKHHGHRGAPGIERPVNLGPGMVQVIGPGIGLGQKLAARDFDPAVGLFGRQPGAAHGGITRRLRLQSGLFTGCQQRILLRQRVHRDAHRRVAAQPRQQQRAHLDAVRPHVGPLAFDALEFVHHLEAVHFRAFAQLHHFVQPRFGLLQGGDLLVE
jgi:hypothetical protein